jgi:hypothetical protein
LLRAAGVANTQQYAIEWVGWSASSVINEIDRIEKDDVKSILYEEAQKWCYLSDAECIQMTRKFVFDLLPVVT